MGTWKEGSFTGNTENYARHIKEALTIEHLSLYRLYEWKLEGGLLC
jgi:flavodoxin